MLLETDLPREKNFIYFVGTGKKGNLTVCRAVMARGGRKKEKKDKKK